ncbi:response regulator [Marinomonas algicola]|uniref:response regulator n=1 Tax=Marinomonas algicola TaxID=2773454 RepID=UPI001747EF64|nr:response regulator [Marinomonas algicola]
MKEVTHILIVEDDEDDYVLTKDCLDELSGYSFKLFWVTHHTLALRELQTGHYDLCLLDYRLGEIDGLSILQEATSQQITTPIVMLTGQSDEQLDQMALEAGAQDFIIKSDLSSPRFDRAIRYALSRKEIQQEKLERQKAEEDNRSKDRFIAHLSHELRTPLTSILGYTEMLLESEMHKYASSELNIILNNGQHLLNLLNDVLDLSKITADKLELKATKVDLGELLSDVYSLMNMSALDNGLMLSITSATPLPEKIIIDATRFRQILINLISNAIKFTKEGSVKVELSLVDATQTPTMLVKVTDTGIGIGQDKLVDIFRPFEQVEDIVTRKEEGAGLGLAISSELINRMGGEISVTSKQDFGSCFTIRLKLQVEESSPNKHLDIHLSKNYQQDTDKPKLIGDVLIVDDLVDIRSLTGHLVQTTGANVEFAENGLEALNKIIERSQSKPEFSLVIMDLHMPMMNGREAIIAIRKQGFTGRIIAMTATLQQSIKPELIQLGFDDVLAKPIDKKILWGSLSKYLTNNSVTAPPNVTLLAETSNPNNLELTQTKTCLLVEDDSDSAQLMSLLLAKLNIKTTLAKDGRSCIRSMKERNHWDLILIDIGLPDMNGLDLVKKLREQKISGEIVILSGEEPDRSILSQLKVRRSILKPVSMNVLKKITSTLT